MDPVDRLASYLADELAPDERAALEAELARDARLRAQLDALRRADAVLAGLRSPTPPDGFDERLETRLDAELTAVLGTSDTAEEAAPDPSDELAARRRDRQLPRWVVAVSGAAAGLLVIAGGGLVIADLFGGAEDDAMTTADAPDDGRSADEPGDMEAMDDATEAFGLPAGPAVAALGRDLQGDEITELLDDPTAFALAGAELGPADAAQLRTSYLAALPVNVIAAEDADEQPAPDAETMAPPAELQRIGDVDDALLADVARCLEVLLADSPAAVPTYAEALTLDGEAVIALGLVSEDPATGAFSRRELWVMSRDGCEVRSFSQR